MRFRGLQLKALNPTGMTTEVGTLFNLVNANAAWLAPLCICLLLWGAMTRTNSLVQRRQNRKIKDQREVSACGNAIAAHDFYTRVFSTKYRANLASGNR